MQFNAMSSASMFISLYIGGYHCCYNSVSSYLGQQHLQFNVAKCKIRFISRDSLSPPPLELNGTVLDSYEYQGEPLTSDLSWP